MKGRPCAYCGAPTRLGDACPACRKHRDEPVAPRPARARKPRCACGQAAARKTKSGWVCRRCSALEVRGYDRFTGVLHRQAVEEGGSSYDNGQ